MTRRVLAVVVGSAFTAALLILVPRWFDGEVSAAAGRLAGGDRLLLAGALLLFLCAPVCSANAWRCALQRRGASVGAVDVASRYGIGCLVNALAPGHLGTALRLGLLTATLPAAGRVRSATGAGVRVELSRGVALASMLAAAFIVEVSGVSALGLLALVSLAGRGPVRWTCAAAAARVAATAASLAAVGVANPVATALVIVPAIDLAGVVQLAPANVGILSAVVAVVLEAHGAASADALAAGIALHAIEATAGIAFGASAALVLLGTRLRHGRWLPVGAPVPA
jgi:hypothetical protein